MASVDGYYMDGDGEMNWAHRDTNDSQWGEYVEGNAKGDAVLVFGRKTYELMIKFWPTPMAAQAMPMMAERMNQSPKIVFSKTLQAADWNNTTLIQTDACEAIKQLKLEEGPDLVILGSGSLIAQLAAQKLVDQYQIVILPLALGAGRTIFEGVPGKMNLELTRSRTFQNGNVVLEYVPEL